MDGTKATFTICYVTIVLILSMPINVFPMLCSRPFKNHSLVWKKEPVCLQTENSLFFTLVLVSQLDFYLLHFGNIANESVVVHVFAKALQLVKVPDEVLADPLGTKAPKVESVDREEREKTKRILRFQRY